MVTILEQIIQTKYVEVEQAKRVRPITEWEHTLEPTTRSFYHAIQKKPLACIAEIKKASPSEGVIRPDFSLNQIVHAYNPFAAALSILTDESYFKGSLSILREVRSLTDLPILRKDFIIDTYQIGEARDAGADSFLLIAAILRPDQLKHFLEYGRQWGMEALVEVHTESEAKMAMDSGARIIGINNRDLHDFSIRLDTTLRIVSLLPPDFVTVSESGIKTAKDVHRLIGWVDTVLIGTTFMKAPVIQMKVQELFGSKVIKVCGITRFEDALGLAQLPVAWMGLIFYPESKRYVEPQQVSSWVNHPDLQDLNKVGVFVNEKIEHVVEICNQLKLFGVQLHGTEDEAYIAKLKQCIPRIAVIKMVSLHPDEQPHFVSNADFYLFDTTGSHQRGGTGQMFDWSLLELVPKDVLSRSLLAGGIGPENIASARTLPVLGLDLNSRVEQKPGIKDMKLIEACVI